MEVGTGDAEGDAGQHDRERRGVVDRIHRPTANARTGRLAAVDTFTLYVSLHAEGRLDDASVDAVARALRPDEEELCVWRDEDDATRLRVSVHSVAADLESALERGHDLAAEACALVSGLTADEVVAMTDEEQLVWRARP
jgi:hypothetical protein